MFRRSYEGPIKLGEKVDDRDARGRKKGKGGGPNSALRRRKRGERLRRSSLGRPAKFASMTLRVGRGGMLNFLLLKRQGDSSSASISSGAEKRRDD